MSLPVIDLCQQLAAIGAPWSPRVAAALNGQELRLARLEGPFVWHAHAEEDELFLVLTGRLRLELEDGAIELGPLQAAVVPRGVRHRPVALPVAEVILFEPASTARTGDADPASAPPARP